MVYCIFLVNSCQISPKHLTNGELLAIMWTFSIGGDSTMIIKTRIFNLCDLSYQNLSELAHAMGLSISQVYRVREGKRSINHKFIIGAKKAFPNYNLDELFYFDSDDSSGDLLEPVVTSSYHRITM